MIRTDACKNYGQLEEQANRNVDVEAFVFRDGEIVRANEAKNTNSPVIHTAPEKNYSYNYSC